MGIERLDRRGNRDSHRLCNLVKSRSNIVAQGSYRGWQFESDRFLLLNSLRSRSREGSETRSGQESATV